MYCPMRQADTAECEMRAMNRLLNSKNITTQGLTILGLFMISLGVLAGPIYKTVDENGNVTYTDQPPDPNAKEADLPRISVTPTTQVTTPSSNTSSSKEDEAPKKNYEDLRMISPKNDQNFHNIGGRLSLRAATSTPLQPGHSVRFYMDGRRVASGVDFGVSLDNVFRGSHQAYAEVVDFDGRRVAKTDSVTFQVHQQSIQNPNNPRNRGG